MGDSLTSDMLGGQNAGIATCWVNPGHGPRKENIRVDYEIEALNQFPALLESLYAHQHRQTDVHFVFRHGTVHRKNIYPVFGRFP